MIESFPIGLEQIERFTKRQLARLTNELMENFKRHSQGKGGPLPGHQQGYLRRVRPKPSKPIVDEIDRLLAAHYGFTDEELGFIINYDINHRMGPEGL